MWRGIPDALEVGQRPFPAMLGVEDWLATGQRVPVRCADGREARLFTRTEGSGAWTTFWHGFPTSSWDWAPVANALPDGRTRLFLDHLGFGDSDKPADHAYTLHEQLDLAVQVWRRYEVEETLLVVHDYSVSMAQELLARIGDGAWTGPRVSGVLFLNGGLFRSVQRPLPIQRLLAHPVTGPLAARLVTRRTFERAFSRIFAEGHAIPREALAAHWALIERREGKRVYAKVSRYHDDRRAHEERWSRALADTDVPILFVWGLQDPVSGESMVERARRIAPQARVVAWPDVGHYPQLEVPERVTAEIARWEK